MTNDSDSHGHGDFENVTCFEAAVSAASLSAVEFSGRGNHAVMNGEQLEERM